MIIWGATTTPFQTPISNRQPDLTRGIFLWAEWILASWITELQLAELLSSRSSWVSPGEQEAEVPLLPCLCSASEHHSSSWQEAIREASAGLVAKRALPTCTDREGEGWFRNSQITSAMFLSWCQAVFDTMSRGTNLQAHHQHFCDLGLDPAPETATTQTKKAF